MDQKSAPDSSQLKEIGVKLMVEPCETSKNCETDIGVSSHDEKHGKTDSNTDEISVDESEKDGVNSINSERNKNTSKKLSPTLEEGKNISESTIEKINEDENMERQSIEKPSINTSAETSSALDDTETEGSLEEVINDKSELIEDTSESSIGEKNIESDKSMKKKTESNQDISSFNKSITQVCNENMDQASHKPESEAEAMEVIAKEVILSEKISIIDVETDNGTLEAEKVLESSAKIPEEDRIESVTLDGDEEKEEEKHGEPEKTEFVQISQDKPDYSHIESQTIEAQDPFGGDNLVDDTLETMDRDEIDERNINFCNLGDQADNLQDVINATSCNETDNSVSDKNESAKVSTASDGKISTSSVKSIRESKNNRKTQEDDVPSDEIMKIVSLDTDSVKNLEGCDKRNKESEVEVIPVENEEQSTVLPGQDDELCIIPDDMKVIIPQRKNKTITSDNKSSEEIPSEILKGSDENSESIENNREILHDGVIAEAIGEKNDGNNKSKQIERVPIEITDSVIDIEDESKNSEVEEISTGDKCKQCNEVKSCKIKVKIGLKTFNVCSKSCQDAFMNENGKATDIPSDGANSKYEKRCASCLLIVETNDDRNLSWETMEFCNEECLGKFQTKYGSYCRNCNGTVQPISLGKYCVRFGYDVRQFCCSTCLEEFKKGLKVCSYCQKDISSGTDGFLAPVGDKGQFKDFCTQQCMEKYSRMNSTEPPPPERKACSVCQEEKIVFCEVAIDRGQPQAICSEPCFAAFKFVNKVDPDQCATCKKYFQVGNKKSTVVFYNNEAHTFCNKSCLNIFIITNRKIVPCNWCKVKKYNFDMIRKELKTGQVVMMCSLNCLTLYQVSINAVSARRIKCDLCKEFSQAQYHLTMSDATIRNFCSYNCVMKFQGQYTKSPITIPSGEDAPVPTGMPKRTYPGKVQIQGVVKKPGDIQHITNIQALSNLQQNIQNKKSLPVISSVASLASLAPNGQASPVNQKATTNVVTLNNATITNPTAVSSGQPEIIYKRQVITRPPSPVQVHNKITQCKPLMHTKGVSVRPHPCAKSTQTDEVQKVIIPIPVPIYVPFPVHMFSFPFPVPMPFPLPIPVPIFIPTTRNSTKGIFKELKRIQEKLPSDPFEAELLMMAEMVATDKKKIENDSDSSENDNDNVNVNSNINDNDNENENDNDDNNDKDNDNDNDNESAEKQETVDTTNNTFGDDVFQMALKIATGELEEPAVDLEAALTSNTITASQSQIQTETHSDTDDQTEKNPTTPRGRKRTLSTKTKTVPNKKGRRSSSTGEAQPLMPPPPSATDTQTATLPQPKITEPLEKPDANMALKFTFGVNAWRQWVIAKNTEFERQSTSTRKVKLFKTDLLQLTADELNYSLCLFVKEVRKPNGAEYAPDTIYYLCLGIQQYLFENNRIDNIFTDTYYEKFTDCLNQVATKFSVLYNDAQYIVTRVEEEHLWECKQLGAHSPHVLLSTLMFFNTKHFNLVSVEEHMQLSFSHIMKHWKRNSAAQGTTAVTGKPPGSRNVLLRFYPPQSALDANSRKKKVYEQQENEENPLRCPVKLYEFYLSKCPESVKTRNDVFYLLPERSCVPDSPVWYSTSPLAKEHLIKMLNRVKMVKEINVALLNS